MKHSKLFLTGMAALLLSFGLMMTGCDSGGDSDDDGGGNTVSFAADVVSGTALKAAVPSGLDAASAVTYAVAKGDKKLTITLAGGGLLAAATGDAIGIVKVGADAATTGNLKGWTATYADAAAIDVTAGDTALAVTATGGSLKANLKVFISTDGATVTVTTANTVSGAFVPATGATVAQEGLKIIVKGLAVAVANPNNNAGATALKSGSGTVTVTLKADAQASQVTAVAAHTGVPVVVPEDSGAPYALIATIAGASQIKFTAASAPNPAKVDWNPAADSGAVGDTPLDPDFDAALIAVLSNLVPTDTVKFDANGNANAVVFTIAPTAAAKLQAVLDNVGGTAPVVTLGAADTAIAAGSTVTIPAGVTVTVAAGKVLSVAGTLAFTDNTSVLALIGADGELKATADTAKFHANATTTTGAGLSLTVTASSDLTTATPYTSTNASGSASVVLTTAGTASGGTGSAYVLGNASLAINNAGTAQSAAPTITSSAASAGDEAAGGIKAGTGSAVKITGASA